NRPVPRVSCAMVVFRACSAELAKDKAMFRRLAYVADGVAGGMRRGSVSYGVEPEARTERAALNAAPVCLVATPRPAIGRSPARARGCSPAAPRRGHRDAAPRSFAGIARDPSLLSR